jgi:hypothetical protein
MDDFAVLRAWARTVRLTDGSTTSVARRAMDVTSRKRMTPPKQQNFIAEAKAGRRSDSSSTR